MLPHFGPQDIFIVAVLYVAAALSTLIWLRFGDVHQTISRSSNHILRILLRLLAVFCGITLLCYFGDIAIWVPILVLLGFLVLGWALSEVTQSVVWNPGIIFLYVIQQYVLGFPDRDDWILPPPNQGRSEPSRHDLDSYIGTEGVTMTALKPMGTVLLNGDRFAAISETGAFIGIETSIIVSSVNGDKLVVRELRTS
jgi:membrane-bound ClpP family serine protease